MTETHAAATSYLLTQRWQETTITEQASVWTKRNGLVVVPYGLEKGTLGWSQLLAGIASVDKTTVEELTGVILPAQAELVPDQSGSRVELDLHLTGPGVRDHETDAYLLGRFLAAASDSVNELIKDQLHFKKHRRGLQVVGGVGAGSVRVQLREPELKKPGQDGLPMEAQVESPEAQALRNLVQILTVADKAAQKPVESLLDAHLQLDLGARRALGQIAGVIVRADWSASGFLLQPLKEPVVVALSLAGANRLRVATQEYKYQTKAVTAHGKVDGWVWSEAELHFLTDDGTRIKAAVPLGLQRDVAHLVAEPDVRATARFQVVERHAPKGARVPLQYGLLEITPDPKLIPDLAT
jgi:hypothetical protein